MKRDGLRESLEQYAHRLNVPAHTARAQWRIDGLLLLGTHEEVARFAVRQSTHVRIAPGVAIPVGPEPCDVMREDETDEQSPATEDNYW